MPLPLPNLDTRRWSDLVDEGRALIPRHAPEWTDHNVHDPGIMLVELSAWVVEQLIYRANRVPERQLRKFLALAGYAPRPPRPATAALAVRLTAGSGSVAVPAGSAWLAALGDGRVLPAQALAPTTVVEAALAAAQAFDGARWADVSRPLRDGLDLLPLGTDPRAPAPYAADAAPAFYLGFDRALPAGADCALYVAVRGARDGEREALLDEAAAAAAACRRDPLPCTPCARPADAWCDDDGGPGTTPPLPPAAPATLPPHHAVRTAWEYLAADGWHLLSTSSGEVDDETRGLTLPGLVCVRLPAPTAPRAVGAVAAPLHWLRCRLLAGSYDETPVLRAVAFNAVLVEQARTAWQRLPVAAGVVAGGPIAAGARLRLALAFDDDGVVTALAPAPAGTDAPEILVAEVVPATATARGALTLPLAYLGAGTGLPDQQETLPVAPVARGEATPYTLDPFGTPAWRRWSVAADLDAAGARDARAALDPAAGVLTFGDGVRGLVPARHAPVLAAYAATAGAAGAIGAARAWAFADDALNRAVAGANFAPLAAAAVPAAVLVSPGADAETVGEAAARAAASLWSHERIVELCPPGPCDTLDQLDPALVFAWPAPARAATTLDVERIAREVPGTRVRRARAWAEVDPGLPGVTVPGTVSLVVVPALPLGRPAPSAGLVRAVARYLDRRRVLCTRLLVVGPQYLEVRVDAAVATVPNADPARVRQNVVAALDRFFDPLAGGPAGRGWPFGRDVFRSEVLQVVDDVAGVDHVLALTLRGDGGGATCGNLCVPPTWLVASGAHAITAEPA
ncbi:putative baseplate assembly protein [Gemmatimonadetes bacterium T265]|nr:putative baseplate assembly protein [Gemmatimonadetes bacterium T265]